MCQKKRRIILFGIVLGTLLLGVFLVGFSSRTGHASAATVHSPSRSVHSARFAPADSASDFCGQQFNAADQINDCEQGYQDGVSDADKNGLNPDGSCTMDRPPAGESNAYDVGYRGGFDHESRALEGSS